MKAKFYIYCIAMLLSGQAFATPAISSVSPASAFKGQTVKITITGTGTFFNITTSVSLQMGADVIKATSFMALSSTKIEATFTIPSNAKTGLWAVLVNCLNNGTLLKNNIFNISSVVPPPPLIISVSPGTIVIGQPTKLTIIGANTHLGENFSNVEFKFGSTVIIPNKLKPISDTKLEAIFDVMPDIKTGLCTLTLSLSGQVDGVLSKSSNLNVLPPVFTFSPSTAIPGQNIEFTITQGEVCSSCKSAQFQIMKKGVDTISAYRRSDFPIVDKAFVSIPNDAAPGVYDFAIWYYYYQDGSGGPYLFYPVTKVNSFTILAPSITVAPNTTYQSHKGFWITISGTNTHFKGAKKISLTNGMDIIYSTALNFNSNTSLSASFDIPVNVKTGLWDINIIGPWDPNPIDGLKKENFDLTKAGCIVINPQPLITTNIPNIPVKQGETVKVAISGTNAHFTSGNLQVSMSQGASIITGTNNIVGNNNSMTSTFIIPLYANTGLWDLNVLELKDDIITKANSFTVNAASTLSPGNLSPGIPKGLVQNNSMSLFPNPAKDQFMLKTNFEKNNTLFTLTITNAQGKVVYSLKEAAALGAYQKTIGISDWPLGVYSINMSSPQGSILQKFIKE